MSSFILGLVPFISGSEYPVKPFRAGRTGSDAPGPHRHSLKKNGGSLLGRSVVIVADDRVIFHAPVFVFATDDMNLSFPNSLRSFLPG